MDNTLGALTKLLPILAFYPIWVQGLVAFTLALALVCIFFLLVLYPAADKAKTGYVADGTLPALSLEARKQGRNYVIESIAMLVDLKTNLGNPQVISEADVRIAYTVFALNETKIFDESFHSMAGAKIERIPGSGNEMALKEDADSHKSWEIMLDLPVGGRRTLVTGARYEYTSPMPNKRDIHDFHNLGPTEDAWCYPNTEDVIGEVTIIIRSDAPLVPSNDGDALLVDRSTPPKETKVPSKPEFRSPANGESGPYIVTARWTNVLPQQFPQIRIARM